MLAAVKVVAVIAADVLPFVPVVSAAKSSQFVELPANAHAPSVQGFFQHKTSCAMRSAAIWQ